MIIDTNVKPYETYIATMTTMPGGRPSIALHFAWLLVATPVLFACGLTYYYWWLKAPAVPLLLGSLLLSVTLSRGVRYTRWPSSGTEAERGLTLSSGLELLCWGLLDIAIYWLLISVADFPSGINFPLRQIFVAAGIVLFTALAYQPLISTAVRFVREVGPRLSQVPRLSRRVVVVLVAYLYVTLTYASLFQLLALFQQNAFNKPLGRFIEALYLSTMTIATVGYGDIVPLSDSARLLVVTEVLSGVVLLVVVLSTVMAVSTVATAEDERWRQSFADDLNLDIPTVWRRRSRPFASAFVNYRRRMRGQERWRRRDRRK